MAHRALATAQAAAGNIGARLTLSLAARRQDVLGPALSSAIEAVRPQLDTAPAVSGALTAAVATRPTAVPVHIMRLPFVGWRDAFIRARQTYAQALTGASGVLLIQGEAGVGKSRLSVAFSHWAQV